AKAGRDRVRVRIVFSGPARTRQSGYGVWCIHRAAADVRLGGAGHLATIHRPPARLRPSAALRRGQMTQRREAIRAALLRPRMTPDLRRSAPEGKAESRNRERHSKPRLAMTVRDRRNVLL